MMLKPACHDAHAVNNHARDPPPTSCETADVCMSRCAAYGHVCPCNARAAGRAANKRMRSIVTDSAIFDGRAPEFRSITDTDIIMGDKLGEGGFAMVNACSLKGEPLDESCAIKYLKRRVMVERRTFEHGSGGLAAHRQGCCDRGHDGTHPR